MTIVASPSPMTTASSSAALKLTCKQEDLARGLAIVKNAVLPHSTAPILKNILVATDRGRLRLSATTLEIGIQVWLDAQIEQAGTTALPADLLTKMVSTFPAGKLTLTIQQGSQTLKLEGAGSLSNIRGTDPKEFPVLPGMDGEQADAPVVVDAGQLKTMIEQVTFAAANDPSKPVMSSVKLVIAGTSLTLVAADSFRLAERMAPLAPVAEAQQAAILVPARNLTELARILSTQGPVQVRVTPQKNQVVFHLAQGEEVDFVTRLIEGTFPSYQKIIPQTHTTRAIVDTKQLVAAVRRASLFAVDTKKTVRVSFAPGGEGALFGTLTIEADDADLGNHVSTVSAEISGSSQQIFFNVKYLEEALTHIETPQVAVEATLSGRPVLLKPVSDVAYTSLMQTMVTPKATA